MYAVFTVNEKKWNSTPDLLYDMQDNAVIYDIANQVDYHFYDSRGL